MTSKSLASLAICATTVGLGARIGTLPVTLLQQSPVPVRQSAKTFAEDVAPIVFTACAPCHRPEGSAPFSLITYRDVKNRAEQIVAVTRDRIMPPWKPEPGYGTFADERRLTDVQIATLQQWVDAGAPEGDPARSPPVPRWAGRWQLGKPDLVLQTPPYRLRATGDDVYRNFVLKIRTTQTRYIRAWQFLPGNARVVHHSTMQLDPSRSSRRLDAEDPEPGYEGLIPHAVQSPDGFFLGWLPGHRPYVAPNGMAWALQKETDLVMMMHLRPSGRQETVQATLGLYFSDEPPVLNPALVRLTRQHMDIPAGQQRYVVHDSFRLDVDVDLHTVQPHAHHLAKEVRSFATLPDGTRKWLIYIRDWDFDWQGVFQYANPEFLPAGTTITMEYTYDNSADNPRNPHRPPHRVTYGQRTMDEMAELWLQVVPRKPADRARLARAVREKIVRESIIGNEKMLEADPANVALHDDVALLHAEAGNLDRTAAHFAESVRLKPDSAPAHYNLGTARLLQGQRATAAEHFRNALTLRPDYALAHDGLGMIMQADGRLAEAIEHYAQAIRINPGDADTHQHMAGALRTLGRLAEAITHYRHALRIDPTRGLLRKELAQVEGELAASRAMRK